jgi:hypothetical protein
LQVVQNRFCSIKNDRDKKKKKEENTGVILLALRSPVVELQINGMDQVVNRTLTSSQQIIFKEDYTSR